MIWNDTGWYDDCDQTWKPGHFFKIRGRYLENKYGSQIEIEQIRPTKEEDSEDGFDPSDFFETSRRDPVKMFAELIEIAGGIEEAALCDLVTHLLKENEEQLLKWPAASKNHHAFSGGFSGTCPLSHTDCIISCRQISTGVPGVTTAVVKRSDDRGGDSARHRKLQELAHIPPVTNYSPQGN